MLSQLIKPKWIGLTLAALALMGAFAALSVWQWHRAQADQLAQAPAVPASAVLSSESPLAVADYGAVVEISGVFDAGHQLLVRQSDSSYWVVTPLKPAAGASVAIARGTVGSPSHPGVTDLPSGLVTIRGVAQPFEGDPGTPSSLPAGEVDRITRAAFGVPGLAQGWIAAVVQRPSSSLTPVAPPLVAAGGLRLQNVSYAIQWVLFAAFVIFMWWRMFRDDLADTRAGDPAVATVAPIDSATATDRSTPRKEVY
ncbi:MAG: SURF1 family protein [Actinomycetes bacterium]